MTRFSVVAVASDMCMVYDQVENRFVPGQSGIMEDMVTVKDVLTQRVDRPELTRADGKLVNV